MKQLERGRERTVRNKLDEEKTLDDCAVIMATVERERERESQRVREREESLNRE